MREVEKYGRGIQRDDEREGGATRRAQEQQRERCLGEPGDDEPDTEHRRLLHVLTRQREMQGAGNEEREDESRPHERVYVRVSDSDRRPVSASTCASLGGDTPGRIRRGPKTPTPRLARHRGFAMAPSPVISSAGSSGRRPVVATRAT